MMLCSSIYGITVFQLLKGLILRQRFTNCWQTGPLNLKPLTFGKLNVSKLFQSFFKDTGRHCSINPAITAPAPIILIVPVWICLSGVQVEYFAATLSHSLEKVLTSSVLENSNCCFKRLRIQINTHPSLQHLPSKSPVFLFPV